MADTGGVKQKIKEQILESVKKNAPDAKVKEVE